MERVKRIISLSTIYPYFNYILKTKFKLCNKKVKMQSYDKMRTFSPVTF